MDRIEIMASRTACEGCRDGAGFDVPFSMAFQPILDAATGRVYAQEALVRGPGGEGAMSVISQVDRARPYAFDQACRVRAIEMAAALGLPGVPGMALSINFLPNAVYDPRTCLRATLAAARRTGMPTDRLIFEVSEQEVVEDRAHLMRIFRAYREMGFRSAIDDFGAGHSGLGLLADFQPDLVKLDMALVRNADRDPARRAILRHVAALCRDLGSEPVAEGVETLAEYEAVREAGISLVQGYLIACPGFEALPDAAAPA